MKMPATRSETIRMMAKVDARLFPGVNFNYDDADKWPKDLFCSSRCGITWLDAIALATVDAFSWN